MIINHSAQFGRRALTLGEMIQILQHRLLPTIIELVLRVAALELIVDLLLRCEGLLEL